MKKKSLFVICLMFAILACKEDKKVNPEVVRPVKLTKVESRSEIIKDFSGVAQAVEFVKLAFRVPGQIVELPIVEGQRVKKGELIAKIDPRDISLQYGADKASYETAKAQMERNKRLLERQAVSKQDYETSVANYERSRSAYQLSQNNIKDTELLAPFDGTIEKKMVDNYQRVNAGEGIVQLVNTNKLRIKFTIPDSYLYLLKSGNVKYKVEFDTGRGFPYNAVLEEYLDMSTDGTGIPVSLLIDDSKFDNTILQVKPGFTCKVNLESDISTYLPEGMTIIPMAAIFEETNSNQKYVWVVVDGRVAKRAITAISPTAESQVLITKGLNPGDSVITAGVHQLIEGQKVKVLE